MLLKKNFIWHPNGLPCLGKQQEGVFGHGRVFRRQIFAALLINKEFHAYIVLHITCQIRPWHPSHYPRTRNLATALHCAFLFQAQAPMVMYEDVVYKVGDDPTNTPSSSRTQEIPIECTMDNKENFVVT